MICLIDKDYSNAFCNGMDLAESQSPEPFKVFSAIELEVLCASLPLQGPSTRNVVSAPTFSVAAGRLQGRNGRPELHQGSTRIFLIQGGAGVLRLGGEMIRMEQVAPEEFLGWDGSYHWGHQVPLGPGMMVSIAAGTPYQLIAEGTAFSFLVFRIDAEAAGGSVAGPLQVVEEADQRQAADEVVNLVPRQPG